MLIDTRFLKIHPRTELWFEQRKQCERCAHVDPHMPTTARESLRCKAVMKTVPITVGEYCIDAREDGLCGPEARFFEERSCAAK